MIDVFTILLLLFVLLTFAFLLIVRSEIVYRATKKRWLTVVILFMAAFTIWITLVSYQTLDGLLRSLASALIFISFLFDSRGITEEGLVINSFDKNGIPFEQIERIVLLKENETNRTKINYFRRGLRGPMLTFDTPIEELVDFLTEHAGSTTKIEIEQGKSE